MQAADVLRVSKDKKSQNHMRDVPAHDLVGEEDPAHLRVLVLALVDDGLEGEGEQLSSCAYFYTCVRSGAGVKREEEWADVKFAVSWRHCATLQWAGN